MTSLMLQISEKNFVPIAWHSLLSDLEHVVNSPDQWSCIYGQNGSGKTTLCREIFEYLPIESKECIILSVFDEKTSGEWLWKAIINQWNLTKQEQESETDCVLRELELLKKENRGLCLLIDEAHKLKNDKAFSDIDHLANLCKLNALAFTVVLIGSHELKNTIEICNLIRNNIGYSNEIKILENQDRIDFLYFELRRNGFMDYVFTPEIKSLIDSKTTGTMKNLKQISKLIQMSLSENNEDSEENINEKLALLPTKREYVPPKIAMTEKKRVEKKATDSKRKRNIKRLLSEDG